ncbi:MAG: acetolactate synthase large subunit [Pseudomonadota bacterium]
MSTSESILRAMVDGGVEVCFANPGTSEMHFVAALDRVAEIRCVLALAESVVTGAADGYARVAGKPAMTLMHTGPGLANGLSNLHNARRAPSAIVNIVGDHADYHLQYDAPLTSDIATLAGPMSHHVGRFASTATAVAQTRQAIEIARCGAGRIVTLVLPADISWSPAADEAAELGAAEAVLQAYAAKPVDTRGVDAAASALRSGEPAMLYLGGDITADTLETAAGIAAACGARLACEVFPTRLAHGAGRPRLERTPYPPEAMQGFMAGLKHLVLLGAAAPVTFFAYPNVRSQAVPDDCQIHRLAGHDDSNAAALRLLATRFDSPSQPFTRNARNTDVVPDQPLDSQCMATVLARRIPQGAVVIDEAISGGFGLFAATAGSEPHDWLYTTGGSLGWALPAAVGAAVAAPRSRIICVVGDGSALYSAQALWSMARERLNVCIIVLANREYAILQYEFGRTGAGDMGARALSMMSLTDPNIEFRKLAEGYGVPSLQASTTRELAAALEQALAATGPVLIEALMPPTVRTPA